MRRVGVGVVVAVAAAVVMPVAVEMAEAEADVLPLILTTTGRQVPSAREASGEGSEKTHSINIHRW